MVVLRSHARRTSFPPTPIVLWCCRRHNLSDRHIPSRHRPHASIDSICLFPGPYSRTSGEEIAWHVGNFEDHVHHRGRFHSFIPRNSTHGGRRGSLRWIELHGLRERTTVLHSRGSTESLRCRQAERRSNLRSRCSDHHISLVSCSRSP